MNTIKDKLLTVLTFGGYWNSNKMYAASKNNLCTEPYVTSTSVTRSGRGACDHWRKK